MKARLPKNYNQGFGNMNQLAAQAQKMQEQMDLKTAELESKEYVGNSPGNDVKVVVDGSMKVKLIEINPEIVNKDDVEMLCDMITLATNNALTQAATEKDEEMAKISGNLNFGGLM